MDFLPRLWATRKIGYLLNEIRLHGTEQELVDEIVDLSLRYGVMTPYTSFLVEEPDIEIFSEEGREKAAWDLGHALAPVLAPEAGSAAVDNAEAIQGYGQAQTTAGNTSATARVVGDKTFVQRDDAWIDSRYQEGMDTTKIGFGGENYYQLLGERPDWGAYFALGEHVVFVADGQAYEVTAGDYPPVDAPANPDASDPLGPNPDLTLPTLVQEDDGGTNWGLIVALVAVGAVVLAAAAGLLTWRRARRPSGGSQS